VESGVSKCVEGKPDGLFGFDTVGNSFEDIRDAKEVGCD
jgi:hypothetical protein